MPTSSVCMSSYLCACVTICVYMTVCTCDCICVHVTVAVLACIEVMKTGTSAEFQRSLKLNFLSKLFWSKGINKSMHLLTLSRTEGKGENV